MCIFLFIIVAAYGVKGSSLPSAGETSVVFVGVNTSICVVTCVCVTRIRKGSYY